MESLIIRALAYQCLLGTCSIIFLYSGYVPIRS